MSDTLPPIDAPSDSSTEALIATALHHGWLSPAGAVRLRQWLTAPAFARQHQATRQAVRQAGQDAAAWLELDHAFHQSLRFGTAGRRGREGVGPGRFNDRVVAETAAALAACLPPPEPEVVVAYDVRTTSEGYARLAAEVLAAHGVRVALYPAARATPQLSFTVVDRGAAGGLMITASHNPPDDNGVKVYGPDGAQIVPPLEHALTSALDGLTEAALPAEPLDQALAAGRVHWLDETADQRYLTYVAGQAVDAVPAAPIRVVYTPLQGVGLTTIPPVLARAGFADVTLVEEQCVISGRFERVSSGNANPEDRATLDRLLLTCRKHDADLGLASDPDADRLGCVVRQSAAGEQPAAYRCLTGNEIAIVMAWHTLCRGECTEPVSGTSSPARVLLRSVVTTPLLDDLAAVHGVRVIGDLPVGYRWFGEHLAAGITDETLVLAADESHGYNRGAKVRDKDAASAALGMAEAVAALYAQGRTVDALLTELYRRHGYHHSRVVGHRWVDRPALEAMLERLRRRPPRKLAGLPVRRIVDRREQGYVRPNGETVHENFLVFDLGGEGVLQAARVAMRPSGTEPKLKLYVLAWGHPAEGVPEPAWQAQRKAIDQRVDRLVQVALGKIETGG